jgi:nickel transport protein
MNRLIIAVCLALAATLCLAAVSEAHKVNIFAYVDGDRIVTDSGYSRTKRVYDGEVEVYDAATGTMLLSGETDTEGKFAFIIPEVAREKKMDLRLLLKAGQGHQAEWTVGYEEFADAPRPVSDMVVEEHPATGAPATTATPEPSAAAPAASAAPASGGLSADQVEAIVRREVEPIKRMLAEMHDSGPTIADIFGGIGWIFGLFGVAAYMKSRRRP